MKQAITFSDVQIEDQYSEVDSRTNVSLATDMGGFKLELPVISANVPQITEYKMATEMYLNGGLGIIHRFLSYEDNVTQFRYAADKILESKNLDSSNAPGKLCGVSIGVNETEKARFYKLYEAGARIFCIDISHGHCGKMKNLVKWIVSQRFKNMTLIAGNIATKSSAEDLMEWGVDILKVGIGPGSVCTTRKNTGVGKPQFSALMEVHSALPRKSKIKVIADGGIKTPGDIAKALIYADAVMTGAILAGTTETPGDVYPEPGTDLTDRRYYKMYGGSASGENKVHNGQVNRFVEGEMKKVPFKGHAKYLLREIEDGLKSSFSLSGASNLSEFKKKVKWYPISDGGKTESKF